MMENIHYNKMGRNKRGLKLILIFLMFFLAINITSAIVEEPRFIGKQNTKINVTTRCDNGLGFECDSTFSCNITIENPSQQIIIRNEGMTKNETVYNLTLFSNQSSILGFYKNDVCCNNGTSGGCETFFHKITPTGVEDTLTQAIIYIIVLLIAMTSFFTFTFFAIKLNGDRFKRDDEANVIDINQLRHLKPLFWYFSYFSLMWIFFIGWQLTSGFLLLDFTSQVLYFFFILMLIFAFPSLVILIYATAVNMITDKKLGNVFRRNLRPRE